MPYTYTDPVREIEIVYTSQGAPYPAYIAFEYLSNPVDMTWTSELTSYDPVSPSAVLQSLRQAHNAPGGLVDNNGNTVVPTIGLHHTTYAQLAERGYVDPLDPDGFTNWENSQKVKGKFAAHATTNATGITLQDGFSVQPRETNTITLDQWVVVVSGQYTAGLLLAVHEYAEVAEADIDEYPQVVGIVKWLNDRKQAGPDYGDTPSNENWGRTHSSFTGHRDFNVVRPGGLTFTMSVSDVIINVEDGDVVDIFVELEADVTANRDNFTRERLASELLEEVTLATGETVETHQEFGHRSNPVRGESLILADIAGFEAPQGILTAMVRDQGNEIWERVPVGSGRIVDHTDLPVTNGNSLVPTHIEMPMVKEIHHYGTAAATVRLIEPTKRARYSGVVDVIRFDNQGTGNYTIRDWNDNTLVVLLPNQSAEVRFVYDRSGDARVIVNAPPRIYHASTAEAGTLDGVGYWNFDSSNYARLMPAVTPQRADADSFARGLAADAPNAATWNATNVTANDRTIRFEYGGIVFFKQSCEILNIGTTTGTITSGHEASLYRKRGTTLTRIDHNVINQDWTGDFTGRTLSWRFFGAVQANDLFVPVWIFINNSGYGGANLTCADFTLQAILLPEIVVEET